MALSLFLMDGNPDNEQRRYKLMLVDITTNCIQYEFLCWIDEYHGDKLSSMKAIIEDKRTQDE